MMLPGCKTWAKHLQWRYGSWAYALAYDIAALGLGLGVHSQSACCQMTAIARRNLPASRHARCYWSVRLAFGGLLYVTTSNLLPTPTLSYTHTFGAAPGAVSAGRWQLRLHTAAADARAAAALAGCRLGALCTCLADARFGRSLWRGGRAAARRQSGWRGHCGAVPAMGRAEC
eukprot:354470-Chlamydomonas_euryale.AAC.4